MEQFGHDVRADLAVRLGNLPYKYPSNVGTLAVNVSAHTKSVL
jgi:hypothetical protein